MLRKVIFVMSSILIITPDANAGEIAGTRVKGDVQLNCQRQGVEIDGKNQIWSFCIEPIMPTLENNSVQPYGFKPTPGEPEFPYKVQEVSPQQNPVINVPTTRETTTAISETKTAITETTTITIETATVLVDTPTVTSVLDEELV
jgi:hypothetical protein